MLRHYLELKAAHPERMVFYWLRGFFGCLLEDAITLSRVLELTPAARRSAKRWAACPWLAFFTMRLSVTAVS